ncbi:protein RecA-like [Schistocerca gregaria]|uniref:protein RecA-like n=1 Tax=Schistocerca gregaria TaxID=7010 RepID=UPI00211DBC3E|nr:protein RecA-like [Schistocerca gregaria]
MKLEASTKPLGPEDVISTGSLSLDLALGIGGLPRGRITEIFGPESSGKTTLALHCIASAQANGGQCVFVDAEHALDVNWARKLGIKTETLLVAQPDSGEQALEIVDTLVQTGQIDVIVLDSVAALVPRLELEGDMGSLQIGAQARLMSQAMRKLAGSLKKNKTLLIFLNQIRMKVGVMFGNPETTSGGNALKYYASIRLDIRRTGSVKKGDLITANQIRVKVAKNKLAPPYRQAEFDIEFDRGISKVGELVDLGIKTGILEKTGSWYALVSDGSQLGQGREKVKQHLLENPSVATELEKMIREKVIQEEEETGGLSAALSPEMEVPFIGDGHDDDDSACKQE